MSVTSRHVNASVARVWEVLCDGWLYPLWVVGAARMRDVDENWPQPGARLHHSVGVWPAMINDTTEVRAVEAPHRLELRARAWPMGEAFVGITLTQRGDDQTTITMEEHAVKGPSTLIPSSIESRMLDMRNREALLRLALIAERR